MRSIKIPNEPGEHKNNLKGRKQDRGIPGVAGRLRSRAGLLLLLGLVCLVIVGPLRGVLAPLPALLFLASFALFLIPGAEISDLIPHRELSGAARIPVAFVFSVGIFGLSGIPMLLLHRSTNEYLVLCAMVLAASLVILAIRAFGRRDKAEDESDHLRSFRARLSVNWPWLPFLVLAGALAYASVTKAHGPEEDVWAYLANVQDFSNAGSLALYDPYFGGEIRGFSRMVINGWLLEQAAISRISGIDPAEMLFGYLTPTMVVLSLLATYALAKTIIGSETGAVLTGCLLAVLFLLSLTTPIAESLLTPGGEFINRVTEDKYVARFVFVPVALALAVLALKKRWLRYLLLFAFVCPSVAVVHPLGLVFIGLPAAGLGLLHILFNLRDRGAWRYVGGLGLAILAVGGPPTLYLLATGSSLLQRMDSMAPTTANSLTQGLSYYDQIQAVGDSYIVDPVFLLNPAVLAAYVLGAPFLVSRVQKSPAAQLLLGTLLLVPILCFVPPIAGSIGAVIGPWILPRLAWPIPLAAVLVLGWLLWEGLESVRSRLERGDSRTEHLAGLLLAPVFVFCALLAAAPSSIAQVRSADESGEVPREQVSCSEPVFAWMDAGLPASSTVLAPEAENSCIMARASSADILNYRKQKPGRNEFKVILERFYNGVALDTEMIRTLQYYEVDYIMLPRNDELGEQMKHRPESFTALDLPGDRYALYEVDLSSLESDALIPANDLLAEGDFEAAADAYEQARGTDSEDQTFLSNLGLGQSYEGRRLPEEAAPYFEQLAALDPEDETAHLLLADAQEAAGDRDGARTSLERALELAPGDVRLRLRLAELTAAAGDEEAAVRQYRSLVEAFPKVPEYRAKLGGILLLAGDDEAANRQFEEATDLGPVSESIHVGVGDALQAAGRLEGAAARYERAIELDPKNQLYVYKLGTAYARLSTSGRNEEDAGRAEETLTRAASLQPVPSSPDRRGAALLSLGDLYYQWGREEEATTVYEQVLEVDPDSEAARSRLEELRS